MINVNDQDQTSAMPVGSENTDDLFAEEAVQGDKESAPAKNVQDTDPKMQILFLFWENDPSLILCTKQLPFEGFIRHYCIILQFYACYINLYYLNDA